MYNIKMHTYEISTAFAKYWRCCAHFEFVTQRICNVMSTNFTNTFGTLLYVIENILKTSTQNGNEVVMHITHMMYGKKERSF